MSLALEEKLAAATKAAWEQEPQGYQDLRLGRLEHQPGVEGRYFGALDVAHGMLRDFALYTVYPLLQLHREQVKPPVTAAVARKMLPVVANYLGYSGFPELRSLTQELLAAIEDCSVEEGDRILTRYLGYVNALYAWAYHYFPWNVGEEFRYDNWHGSQDLPDNPDTLAQTDCLIRLRWEPIGIEVKAFLAVDLNTELCKDILAAMPFRCLQVHPIVAGQSLMAYSPLTTTAPTPFREEIRRAPVGRLRYNASTGQKFIVQYGRTSEDILAPVIGSVLPEDRHLLAEVGRAVWASTYHTKQPIWLHVERF